MISGEIVRVNGHRGLYVAREEAPGRNCWWFLPCDQTGRWNQKEGWRAFRLSECRKAKR